MAPFFPRCLWLAIVLQLTFADRSKREITPVQIEASKAVKVFHQSKWGYICANKWDSNDAKVICRMQGYWHDKGVASVINTLSSDFQLDNVVCTGEEDDISACVFSGWGLSQCPLNGVAGVDCETTDKAQVRLSSGYGAWEGRVEVYNNGDWHPVCGHNWDDKDAAVVCRSLGLSTRGGRAHSDNKYGSTTANPLIVDVNCLGTEKELTMCKASRKITDPKCDLAGVECYNCGAEYMSATGSIQSANYPSPYPGYLNCLYVIRPPDNGELYKLEFPDFKTEECCDKLQVTKLTTTQNFPDGGQIYSGDNKPPTMLGKAFAVLFTTDGSKSFNGFQAKWSPARVEDLVDITCDSGSVKITIDLLTLKRLYPESSEKTIALANPNCTGSMTVNDKLVITAHLDSCGTHTMITSTSQIYSNFLVDRVFATSNPMIVRQERWKIPIRCEVSRDKDFLLHYNPYANSKRGADALRSRREVKGHITQTHPFPVQMEVYADQGMMTRLYESPVRRSLGENLFLRLNLAQGDSDLNLVLNDCFARPSYSSAAQTYYLIKNGCEVDSKTHILRQTSHYTDIQVVVFEFSGDYPQVFITCDVRVCPNTDHSPSCTQSCTTNPGRRDTQDQQNSLSVTFGPVEIEE